MKAQLVMLGIFFAAASFNSNAGIFGPSNFEECIVEKMKGQDFRMKNIVAEACEIQFPHETEIFEAVKLVGWATETQIISVEIEYFGKYKITRLDFAVGESCDGPLSREKRIEEITLLPTPSRPTIFSGKARKSTEDMKCGAIVGVYGIRKK